MSYGQRLMITLVSAIWLLCALAWVLAAFAGIPWFISLIPLLLALVGASIVINETGYYQHEDEGSVY